MMERSILMAISQAIGILGSLVGTTATLLGAWAYIRSKRPPKTELLIAGLVVGVILVVILGIAVLISRETNISINGQKSVPVPVIPVAVPGLPGPSQPGPGPAPTSTPTLSPTSTPSAAPSPSTSPTAPPSVSPTSVPTSPIPTSTSAPATPQADTP